MTINIDESAGFCWGVVRTIEKVEECLKLFPDKNIYVLGQIIHNPREIERLEEEGLLTIEHYKLNSIPKNSKVIIRAHGEPPITYKNASDNGIELIDATCPLVKALQQRVKKYYENGWQIVIFGKREHAEVIGLRGVCNDDCLVVKSVQEALENINFSNKIVLLSQTTMDKQTFSDIKSAIENKLIELQGKNDNKDDIELKFLSKNTICKYVSERSSVLEKFAHENDLIIFVAGKNSSNGKILYDICRNVNPNTYFIEDIDEIDYSIFNNIQNVGITGATSTPKWYLNLVKSEIERALNLL